MTATKLPENSVECASRAAWRRWLMRHHATSKGVWLITYKKAEGGKHIPYDDIVEEALCFGWVDSLPRKLDAARTMLYVSPRKPKSGWAKPNKLRVERLIKVGLMMPAGLAAIETAKSNGAWTLLDEAEAYVMPPDLATALKGNAAASRHFDAFPPGVKKAIYQWIVQARKPETRATRIANTVALAAGNIRANHPRQPKSAGPASRAVKPRS